MRFQAITGQVLAPSRWSDTVVEGRSHGGGGTVTGYGGYVQGNVSAPSVEMSSTVRQNIAFFLKSDDGMEHEVKLQDAEFGVREGHQVTAVRFSGDGSPGPWLLVYNHQTSVKWYAYPSIRALLGMSPFAKALGCSALAAVAAGIGYAMFQSPWLHQLAYDMAGLFGMEAEGIFLLAAAGGVAFFVVVWWYFQRKFRAEHKVITDGLSDALSKALAESSRTA